MATEIDLLSTYIGGSRECIDAVLATSEPEAIEAEITHGVDYTSDRINPPPDEPLT